MSDQPIRPSPFDFWDFRAFIRARLEWMKLRDPQCSLRRMNEKAGFKGAGFLSMVLSKKRNLSESAARRLSEAMDLTTSEQEFFIKLAAFNQSLDFSEKDRLYKELLQFKKFKTTRKMELAQYEFFNHWYYSAIFEILADPLPDRLIAKIADGLEVSETQARECLEHLEQLGLARHEQRQWVRTESIIQGASDLKHIHLRIYHREMIQKALTAVDQMTPAERELSGVTIALSQEKFDEVRKLVFKFQEDINAVYSSDPHPDKVYQLNIQLFPLGAFPKARDR